jgi:hypothetical protein
MAQTSVIDGMFPLHATMPALLSVFLLSTTVYCDLWWK